MFVVARKLRVVFTKPTDVWLNARSDLLLVTFSNIDHSSMLMVWPGLAVLGAKRRSSKAFWVTCTACVLGTSPVAAKAAEPRSIITTTESCGFFIFLNEAIPRKDAINVLGRDVTDSLKL